MHVLVLNGWRIEETADLTQIIAVVLGLTVFEVQQRMIGGGPAVLATFADPQHAGMVAEKLSEKGISVQSLDADEVCSKSGTVSVRHFEFNDSSLFIETRDNQRGEIPFQFIDLLLSGTISTRHSETQSVSTRKFSLGKTLLAGGIPISKQVERRETQTAVNHGKVLYLYAGKRLQPVIFNRDNMTFEGLGEAMQITRNLNFDYLISELRRRNPGAVYDDRLQKRIALVRLLGPTLDPAIHFDLAAGILSRYLRLSGESTAQ